MASNIKKTKAGFVYILANSINTDVIKVGEANNAEERAELLSRQTGSMGEYSVIWKHKIEDDNQSVEKALHYKLREYHLNKEYFKIDKKKAIKIAAQLMKDIKPLKNPKAKRVEAFKKDNNSKEYKLASKTEWKEVSRATSKEFIKEAIMLCLKEGKVGQPQYRRFSAIRNSAFTTIGGFDLYVMNQHLRVGVTFDSKVKAKKLIKAKIGSQVNTKDWEGGVTFIISNQKEFNAMKRWLRLGQKQS
ncbi:hypothetical protein CNR22_19605 [Sphingobacteriaceae bacterium]|nr:hypothetical protein CNR22_19605 [Sphingobacteriaceae bacterium]